MFRCFQLSEPVVIAVGTEVIVPQLDKGRPEYEKLGVSATQADVL